VKRRKGLGRMMPGTIESLVKIWNEKWDNHGFNKIGVIETVRKLKKNNNII